MRRRTTLGDRNLVGENIIRIRAEKKMSQGHSIQSNSNGLASAGPALDHLGSYDTTNWQEVVYLMGGIPQIPQWLPEGCILFCCKLKDAFST